MKIALISDLHFGARNSNLVLLNHLKNFFDTVFFPYLEEHKIDTVCILGDLLDRRKSADIIVIRRMRKDFLEKLTGKEVHIIAGNHDTVMKNTNEMNSLTELLRGYGDGFHIYLDPQEIVLDGTKILALPWICPENEEESLKIIKNTKAKVCFAHLELLGIEMRKGSFSEIGQEPAVFSKFDTAVSGHYHYASTKGNIHYLGAPYQITWTDYADKKGFSIFDTETLKLEFIENPYKLFHKIEYDDSNPDKILLYDEDVIRNTYVKVVVKCRENVGQFDKFISKIENLPVIDLQIVDNHLLQIIEGDESVDQAESTLDILYKSIDQMDIKKTDKKELNRLLSDLYSEAHVINA